MTAVAISLLDLPNTYISGFTIAVASNTTLTVSAGICRDSTNGVDINLGTSNIGANGQFIAAPLTLNTAVLGANGIDVGAFAASTLYAVYMIADSLGYKPTACTMTLASNATPGLPFGYDVYRLIGYAASDASTFFLKAYISGTGNSRVLTYDATQATSVTAGTSATYAPIALTALVCPVDNTPVMIHTNWIANAAADILAYQGFNSTGDAIRVISATAGSTANTVSYDTVLAQLNTAAPSINYKVSAVGGVAVKVAGFQFFV